MCIVHKNEQSAHAQKLISCPARILAACRLPFKEENLSEGEWVCHEYMNFVIQYAGGGGGGGGGGGS